MLNLNQMLIQQFIDLLGFQFVLLFKLLLFKSLSKTIFNSLIILKYTYQKES